MASCTAAHPSIPPTALQSTLPSPALQLCPSAWALHLVPTSFWAHSAAEAAEQKVIKCNNQKWMQPRAISPASSWHTEEAFVPLSHGHYHERTSNLQGKAATVYLFFSKNSFQVNSKLSYPWSQVYCLKASISLKRFSHPTIKDHKNAKRGCTTAVPIFPQILPVHCRQDAASQNLHDSVRDHPWKTDTDPGRFFSYLLPLIAN